MSGEFFLGKFFRNDIHLRRYRNLVAIEVELVFLHFFAMGTGVISFLPLVPPDLFVVPSLLSHTWSVSFPGLGKHVQHLAHSDPG